MQLGWAGLNKTQPGGSTPGLLKDSSHISAPTSSPPWHWAVGHYYDLFMTGKHDPVQHYDGLSGKRRPTRRPGCIFHEPWRENTIPPITCGARQMSTVMVSKCMVHCGRERNRMVCVLWTEDRGISVEAKEVRRRLGWVA